MGRTVNDQHCRYRPMSDKPLGRSFIPTRNQAGSNSIVFGLPMHALHSANIRTIEKMSSSCTRDFKRWQLTCTHCCRIPSLSTKSKTPQGRYGTATHPKDMVHPLAPRTAQCVIRICRRECLNAYFYYLSGSLANLGTQSTGVED